MRPTLAFFIFLSTLPLAAQSAWPPSPGHTVLTLWPGAAPDATASAGLEGNQNKPTDGLIAGQPIIRLGNVSTPTLTLYRATAPANGAAVVVFPGGGYSILAIDLEGTEVCDWLTARGVTCILLKYRVPNSGPYPKSRQALEDAQRAISLVRQHAAEWQLDPHRIGVLGFSAGGHLAAALSTHDAQRLYPPVDAADTQPIRPDFAVIVYPGYLANPDAGGHFTFTPDILVTADTPPTFLLQAEDDPVHVENAVDYFLALKAAKVPAELHVYAQGGHGLRRTTLPVTHWPDLVDTWLKTIKMIP